MGQSTPATEIVNLPVGPRVTCNKSGCDEPVPRKDLVGGVRRQRVCLFHRVQNQGYQGIPEESLAKVRAEVARIERATTGTTTRTGPMARSSVCLAEGCEKPPRKKTGKARPHYCDEHAPPVIQYHIGDIRPCETCGEDFTFGWSGKVRICSSCYGMCRQCGAAISTERLAKLGTRFCSTACEKKDKPPCSKDGCSNKWFAKGLCQTHYNAQNAARQLRGTDAQLSRAERDRIYRRDHGTCGICGESVPFMADTYDPKAPTMDHVVPRSEGGTHAPANLRLAHRACNQGRGNRGGNEQLALIG